MTRSVVYLLGGIHFFAGLSMTLPGVVGLWVMSADLPGPLRSHCR